MCLSRQRPSCPAMRSRRCSTPMPSSLCPRRDWKTSLYVAHTSSKRETRASRFLTDAVLARSHTVRAHAHTYTCTHMRINAITRVRNFVTSCSPLVACAGQAEEQTRLGRLWVLEVVQVLPRPRPRGPFLLTFVLGAFMLAPVLAPLPPTPYTRSHLSPYGTLACGTRCRSKTMEGIQRVLGASALTNPPILGCEVCPRDCPLRTSAACRCWLLTVPYAFVCGSRDVCMRVRVWMCWPGPLIDCPGSEVLTRSLN